MKPFALFLYTGALLAQTQISALQVRWQQVDFSACGGTKPRGTSIKIAQIRRPPELRYELAKPAPLPSTMRGPSSPDIPPTSARQFLITPDCWPADLWRAYQAVITTQCIRCHGDDVRLGDVSGVGNLDLRTKASTLKGGNRGPAFRPGDPWGSLLFWYVVPMSAEERSKSPTDTPLEMPPFSALTTADIETIRAWIANGAPEVF